MTGVATDAAGATVSWRELLSEATERLRRVELPDPATDARRIVEASAGFEPSEFHSCLDSPATERRVALFDSLVSRREGGEPLQYVIGRWGFRSLDLHVDERVLIPRPETEMVAGLVVDEANRRATQPGEVVVADLGTGSGAIALAVAVECPRARVVATDRSAEALAVARANLAGLGRAATRVTTHEGDWFDALPVELRGCIDLLVSNPPYVADGEILPEVVGSWEPAAALRAGPRGTEQLEVLVDGAAEWLAADGVLVVELAPDQAPTIAARARALGYATTVHPDLAGRDRAVVARR